jgi:GR25 family glycosyltransferase involved in LPS biosynthesis
MDITFNYKNLSPFIKKFKINNKLILVNYFNKKDNLELVYEINDYKYNILDAKVKNIKICIENKEIDGNYFNLGNSKIIKFILDKNYQEYMIDYVRLYSNIKNININSFFSKIYVISLKSEINNKKIIKEMFDNFNINFSFFNATDGKNDDECKSIFDKYQKEPLCGKNSHIIEHKINKKILNNLGEIGYLKSWENIILDAIENNLNSILIFDDDVILHKNFNILMMDYLYYINKYKIINLGNTEYCSKELIDNKIINNNISYYNSTDLTDGSFAVGIHNSIYNELLLLIRRFNAPLDTGCLRDLYLKYPNDCYSCNPNLAIAWVGKSGIHNKKDIYKTAIKLNWNLNNYNWFPYYQEKIAIFYIIDSYEKIENGKKFFEIFKKDNYELFLVNMLDIDFNYKNNEYKIINLDNIINNIKDSIYFGIINNLDIDNFEKKLQLIINQNFNKILNKSLLIFDCLYKTNNFIKFSNNNQDLLFLDLLKKYNSDNY